MKFFSFLISSAFCDIQGSSEKNALEVIPIVISVCSEL